MKRLLAYSLIILSAALAAACGPKAPPPQPAQLPTDDEIIAHALNHTYNWMDIPIKLTNGVYEKSGERAPICKVLDVPRPVGALDTGGGGTARGTALALAVNTGGSGTFVFVVANYTTDGRQYTGTNSVDFGDRNTIHNIKIVNGDIVVDYLVRKYRESMATKPTVPATRVLAIKNSTLAVKRHIGYLATAGTGQGTMADLRKGGLEVIKEHSFPAEFANCGKVQFTAMDYKSFRSASFYLIGKDGDILYTFPERTRIGWEFARIRAVAAADVNGDGLADVIIINEYNPVAGAQETGPVPYASVHFQKDNGFVDDWLFADQLNDARQNADIQSVLEYAKGRAPQL